MPKFKTKQEAFDACEGDGFIRDVAEINKQQIIDSLRIADISIESADFLAEKLSKSDPKWMMVFLGYYEGLRIYSEVMVKLQRKSIPNHQCLFAYLCTQFSKLELHWEFFETIRTKRNGAHYYGKILTYLDWKDSKVEFELTIKTLKKTIENMLEEG